MLGGGGRGVRSTTCCPAVEYQTRVDLCGPERETASSDEARGSMGERITLQRRGSKAEFQLSSFATFSLFEKHVKSKLEVDSEEVSREAAEVSAAPDGARKYPPGLCRDSNSIACACCRVRRRACFHAEGRIA